MSFNCAKCGECCKKYFVQILPTDAVKISDFLNISLKKFINNYTQLFLQFFIGDFKPSKLVLPSAFISNKLLNPIKKLTLTTPNKLLVLPTIAFKRIGKNCVFLNELNQCKIYPLRPLQCKIFPFVSVFENETNFLKLYPFCKGLQESNSIQKNNAVPHFVKTKNYFLKIQDTGFNSQWKHLPNTGLSVLESRVLTRINKNDFLKVINTIEKIY